MKSSSVFIVLLFLVEPLFSQVGVNITNPTETLDVNGTLRIREINNGTNLAASDSILVINGSGVVQKVSAATVVLEGSASGGIFSVLTDGTVVTGDGTPNNEITLGQNGATSGQVLRWNGTTWTPSNDVVSTLVKVNAQTYTYRSETGTETTISLSQFLDNTDNQDLTAVLTEGNDAGGMAIENLADPANAQDAATKNYVDTAITNRLASNEITIAEIYDAVGGQTLNESSSFSDIDFGTAGIIDTNDYSNSTNSITISKAGRYEITYRVSTKIPDKVNNRTGGEFYLEVGGSESPGTRAYSYQRNNDVDKNTVTVNKIIEIMSTPVVMKVKGRVYESSQNGQAASLNMVANGSSLIIKKIK